MFNSVFTFAVIFAYDNLAPGFPLLAGASGYDTLGELHFSLNFA